MTQRLVIDRLRISGLAGAPPSRAAVEAALRAALAASPPGAALTASPPGAAQPADSRRVTAPAGSSLDGAARQAATAIFGRNGR